MSRHTVDRLSVSKPNGPDAGARQGREHRAGDRGRRAGRAAGAGWWIPGVLRMR